MPNKFNVGKIIPILKDVNGNSTNLKNVRPITIADALSNVYEKYIQNSSCQHALFTMQELIKISAKRGEATYVCALDASKAFDKVNRKIMMTKLKDKIDKNSWSSFKKYYDTAEAFVRNKKESSARLSTKVGVKHGGPNSPLLFSINSEELIERIKRLGTGVRIGKIVVGIICFAENVLLITENVE